MFREQVISVFSADRSVLAIGVTILTAQLVAMVANGFTGLLTSLFQATGRALAATVMSVTQGVLFIPIVLVGNLWFGLSGIIWALTVTEGAVLARRRRDVARVPSARSTAASPRAARNAPTRCSSRPQPESPRTGPASINLLGERGQPGLESASNVAKLVGRADRRADVSGCGGRSRPRW